MGEPRSPRDVVLLVVATLGVYYFVWYYRTNRELLTLTPRQWNVGLWTALLVLPVVGLVSLYRFAEQVRRAHAERGVLGLSPVALFLLLGLPFAALPFLLLGVLPTPYTALPLLLLDLVGVYVAQDQVNKVWAPPLPVPLESPRREAPAYVPPAAPQDVPEVLPAPGPAVLALALGWSSVVLALAGPAGILAGAGSLHFRRRFLALERATPGHRGARFVATVHRWAVVGVAVGAAVTALLVAAALTSDTTVPAK